MEKLYVCDADEVISCRRKQVVIRGRDIFLLNIKGVFYALDSFCYHAGGPLNTGDIEEYGGRTCVTCPWHRYRICVSTGEGLYESINPFDLSEPAQIKSKGVKQRTYKVINENGKLFIEFCLEDKIESDYYNDKENRDKMKLS